MTDVDAWAVKQHEREEAKRRLREAADQGELLSKNAQKRLKRLEARDERIALRKEERKLRKAQRQKRQALEVSRTESTEEIATDAIETAPPIISAPISAAEHAAAAWAFWARIGSPTKILAPMVNQSELAFRLLARKHGAQLCYTPMLHAAMFASEENYRKDNFEIHPSDRPLVVQFCGDDPQALLSAALLVQDHCDAVELNCGCPQAIAKRGHYGAFLLDEPELIVSIVAHMAPRLRIPVMVKMRVVPSNQHKSGSDTDAGAAANASASQSAGSDAGTGTNTDSGAGTSGTTGSGAGTCTSDADADYVSITDVDADVLDNARVARAHRKTVALGLALQRAGCSVVTLHGRTREEKTRVACDWEAIAALRRALSIPVVANGGICVPEDIRRCLAATGAAGVMSSEAALENPAIFNNKPTSRTVQTQLAREYIQLAREHPPRCASVIKAHLFKLLYMGLNEAPHIRHKLGEAMEAAAILATAEEACAAEEAAAAANPEALSQRCDHEGAPHASWYRRHRHPAPDATRADA